MKLPIIEALKTSRTGKLILVNRHISVINKVEEASIGPMGYRDAYEFRTEALFRVDQISSDSRGLNSYHERAVHMLTKEIYGPVTDELYKILHLLWENGPLYDDKIAKAVEQLIEDLKP